MPINSLSIFETSPHLKAAGLNPVTTHRFTRHINFATLRNNTQGLVVKINPHEFGAITRPTEAAGSSQAKEATRSLHAAARLNLLTQYPTLAESV